MKFLTCEPPIKKDDLKSGYLDEADQFYLNPNEWYTKNHKDLINYNYVVLFRNLYDDLLKYENQNDKSSSIGIYLNQFKILKTFFHSFIIQSKRNHRELLILFKSETKKV